MSDLADITAIVPVSDRPQLLVEAVASICAGTVLPKQIIVVYNARDHATRDRDRAALDAWQQAHHANQNDSRIEHVICEIPGPAAARNAGAVGARCRYLAFLDSDDLWTERKLELQLEHLARRPHLHACHTAERWIKNDRLLQQPQHLRARRGRFLGASFYHCLISCSSILMERRVFEELGGFDEAFRVCEDFELWLRYLARRPIGLAEAPAGDGALTIKRSGGWPQESSRYHSLDALRIRAVLKLMEHDRERLSQAEIDAARAACERKLGILAAGAEKYDTRTRVDELRERVERTFA